MVSRQGHQGHPTHRVSDQNQWPSWHDRIDHGVQVVPELVDLVGLPGPCSGPTVAPGVPEHDAVAGRLESSPLEHPAAQAQRVAVAEHHRRDLCPVSHPRRTAFGLVDLDVQRHAVVGDDDDLRGGLFVIAVHRVQRLSRLQSAGQTLGDDTHRSGGPRCCQTDADSGQGATTAVHG